MGDFLIYDLSQLPGRALPCRTSVRIDRTSPHDGPPESMEPLTAASVLHPTYLERLHDFQPSSCSHCCLPLVDHLGRGRDRKTIYYHDTYGEFDQISNDI